MQFPRRTFMTSRTIASRMHKATAMALAVVTALLGGVYVVESRHIDEMRLAGIQSATDTATGIAAAYEQAEKAGRLTRAEAQARALVAIGAIRGAGGEKVIVTDASAHVVSDPALQVPAQAEGADDASAQATYAGFADVVREKGAGISYFSMPGETSSRSMVAYAGGFEPWGWILSNAADASDGMMARLRVILVLIIAGAWSTLMVGLVVQGVGRRLSTRLKELAAAAELLAQGELSFRLSGVGGRDEPGVLAHALDTMRRRGAERLRIVKYGLEERAARERRQAAMDRLTSDFSTAVSGVLTRLTHTARAMSGMAGRIDGQTSRGRDEIETVRDTEDCDVAAMAVISSGGSPGVTSRQRLAKEPSRGGKSSALSRKVVASAAEISEIVEALRDEVDQFVQTISRGDDFRRRYERVPGHDAPATVSVPNGPDVPATIRDISRGGAALDSAFEGDIGATVMVALPGSNEPVMARIVRHAEGTVMVAFRQDERTAAEVDAVIDRLAPDGKARWAA